MIKQRAILSGILGLASTVMGWAGELSPKTIVPTEADAEVLLNVVSVDTSYGFSAPFEFAHQEMGRGDVLRNRFEATRRIPIQGPWHFQIGAGYDRFDFGGSATQVLPSTLQSFCLPVGISYIVDGQVRFLAQVRPGFYFEREVTRGAFDIPFNIGGGIPLIEGKLYGVWGVGTSILRRYPVVPVGGVIWLINDRLRLLGYVPEPRVVYDLNKQWQLWAGGEIVAGSFKAGQSSDPRLSNTVVDYEDYRVGVGVIWSPAKHWQLIAGAGYSLQRSFTYDRPNQTYTADPAPVVKLQFSGEF